MKTSILIITIGILIGGSILLSNREENKKVDPTPEANNVSIVDGQQVVEIKAKGGYVPRKSVAKAGVPTVIKFNTEGTFDCSSAVVIPSLNISKNLPPSGLTEIDLGNPVLGTLQGTCGMGMYPFEIEFQA